MIWITAIQMSGGSGNSHIGEVLWLDDGDGKTGKTSRAGMVEFIDVKKNTVKVGGRDGPAIVGVVKPANGTPYLRTYRDKEWNDNLLALPRY